MEGFGIIVVLLDVAVDGGLEVDDGAEDAAFEASPGERGEEALDGVDPEADVGVKWNVQRGWRASHARTLGCLCVA